jgi:hypothetical protein
MKIFKIGKAIVIGALFQLRRIQRWPKRGSRRLPLGPSCQRNGGPRRRGRCRAVQKTGVPSRCRRTSFAWLPTRDLCQGMPEGAVAFSVRHRDMYWIVEAERSPLFRASAFTFDSMFAVAALIGLIAVLLPNMVCAARRSLRSNGDLTLPSLRRRARGRAVGLRRPRRVIARSMACPSLRDSLHHHIE